MRISIEGWKEAGRDLPNTVGKTSLFTKAIIEKYGQGDNYVFDPAMLVYLVKAEQQPEEEKKSPSEERAKEYVIREKEVLKLVTQQEKSKEFLTRIMKTSTIPGGRELLKRKSFRQQFAIWIQTFIKEYQEYVQNTLLNTSVMNDAKTEILNELTALTKTLELWNHATSMKESSYQNEIEKKVQEIRQKREKLEKQEYLQKVQRMFLQEMERIDTKLSSEEEEKDASNPELNYLLKSSIMELTEEERKELYRELVDIKNVREEQHKFRTTGSNVHKYLESLQSVYLEEILLKTLERKEIAGTFAESYPPQNRILTLEEWERENILSVEESAVREGKTGRELRHLVRNRLMEMSEEERQTLYRELVNIKNAREERHELYEKQENRIMNREEEEKVLQKLQTIREKEWEHRKRVQTTCLESTELKEKITESLEAELFKILVKKEVRLEKEDQSQSRILSFDEWEREIIHRVEENMVQEEKTESIEKTERSEKTEHELHRFIRNSLTELSEKERQELYRELVNKKEVRKEQREQQEKLMDRVIIREENKVLQKVLVTFLEELEKKESAVQTERTEKELHHLVRNSLMEMSEEERQDFYKKLITAEKAEEIEQVISHRIGMTQAQEQTLIRELQTVFLEEVRKEEILVEMPEIQRNYMQTLLQFRNQEYAQTSNLERELIQNEENQTVQSEKDSIERFYYNRSQVENIEKIRMEQREQFLNLQEISRQQGEQLEKMEIQQKELKEKLERAKQNPYEQEQKVMQKLENQLRLEQLRRGLA